MILEIDHIDQRRGKLILDFGQCLLRRQLIDDILQRIVQPADGIQDLAQDLTHRLTDQPEQIGLDLPDERVEDLVHDPVPDIGGDILGQVLHVTDSILVQIRFRLLEDFVQTLLLVICGSGVKAAVLKLTLYAQREQKPGTAILSELGNDVFENAEKLKASVG